MATAMARIRLSPHALLSPLLALCLVLLEPLAAQATDADPAGSESAIVVCDGINCEMDCRRRTKDCGVYGCYGVCIGYACHCFTKPRVPAGGWKEYSPLDADETGAGGDGGAGGAQAQPPPQQQQQQQPQPQQPPPPPPQQQQPQQQQPPPPQQVWPQQPQMWR